MEDTIFIITWIDGAIQVQIRYPNGLIPQFSQLVLSNGSTTRLEPPNFEYGLLLRVAIANVPLQPEQVLYLNSTYRDTIPYTYNPPSQGGDGIITFTIGMEDTNPADGHADWFRETSKGFMCMEASNWSTITWKWSNVIGTGGTTDKGAPTILGVIPSCDGIVTDFLAYSQQLLVTGYQYVIRGFEWNWVTFDTPQYAGQAHGMATNPKETNVLIRLRDTLGDVYEFDIGYKAIPKQKMLWATNWLYGYGGNFYG